MATSARPVAAGAPGGGACAEASCRRDVPQALLRRHADTDTPTPVLLRGARGVRYRLCGVGARRRGRAATATATARARARARTPLRWCSPGIGSSHTSRIGPLPEGLAPAVRAWLLREGVAHALPAADAYARLVGVLALFRRRACHRCYLKQLRLDMHAPSLLARLRPRRGTLGDASCGWAATTDYTPTRTQPAVDARRSQDRLALPPRTRSLRPARMLDLVTNATDASQAQPQLDRRDRRQ